MRSLSCVLPALVLGLFCAGSSVLAQTATTEPFGFYRLPIKGASDNFLSLPIPQPPAFSGGVDAFTANTVKLKGAQWQADQFKFAAPGQPQTYYLEFATGNLRGLFYKILQNTSDTLTLDMEGDDLTNHPRLGALALSDAARIRPYWRIRDVFGDSSANLVIDARPNRFEVRDDILIPDYINVGAKKSSKIKIYFISGVGWRKAGDNRTDMGNFTLPPNTGVIVRRRNPADSSFLNLGQVLVYRSAPFIPGGNGTSPNETFTSLSHAAPTTLAGSSLRTILQDSPDENTIRDSVFVYNSVGINPTHAGRYYFVTGLGWRQVGSSSTTVGQDVIFNPGTTFLLRKKPTSPGGEWLREPNY